MVRLVVWGLLVFLTGCKTWQLAVTAGVLTGLAEATTRNNPHTNPIKVSPPTIEVESAYIHKVLDGQIVLIERQIWGKWLIKPKMPCYWVRLYQGRWVKLIWKYPTATLINQDGATCECSIKDRVRY